MVTIIQEPQAFQNTPPRTVLSHERPPHKSTSMQDHPHISASQFKSYAGCPLAWRLSRTQRPAHVSAALVFGSAFHAAAERYYQMRLEGKEAKFQDLLEAYDANWTERGAAGENPIPVKFPAKIDPVSLRQTAIRMLEAFLVHANANPGEVIAVEEPFEIELAPGLPVLQGRIDLVEIRTSPSGGKTLQLADLKTAAKRMSENDIDRDQLNLYAIAARRTGLLEQFGLPLVLRIDSVTKSKTSEVIPITIVPNRSEEARIIAKARELWKGMSAGICFPNASWRCPECGYRDLCAKWPDLPGIAGPQDQVQ